MKNTTPARSPFEPLDYRGPQIHPSTLILASVDCSPNRAIGCFSRSHTLLPTALSSPVLLPSMSHTWLVISVWHGTSLTPSTLLDEQHGDGRKQGSRDPLPTGGKDGGGNGNKGMSGPICQCLFG